MYIYQQPVVIVTLHIHTSLKKEDSKEVVSIEVMNQTFYQIDIALTEMHHF